MRCGDETAKSAGVVAAVDSLRARLEVVSATFVDADIQERLDRLRNHLSTAATMLRNPTPTDLQRVDERVDYATKQFALLTKPPATATRGPQQRQRRFEP